MLRVGPVLGLFLALLAGRVLAQEPPATQPANELRAIQEKGTLTDDDRALVRRTIDRHIGELTSDGGSATLSQLREEARGSNAYHEAYVAALLDSTNAAYKTAKLTPATQLIALIGSLNEASAQRLLIEAVTDKRPAVRTAAAVGLRNLHAKLVQQGGSAVSDTLSALKEAAKAESSAVTLKAIFAAMNFADAGAGVDTKANAAALLDVLEDRATRQYTAGNVRAEGADIVAINAINAFKSALVEADRERWLIALGKILSRSVMTYANELADSKENLSGASAERRHAYEQLISETEKLLTEQLKPKSAPTVSKVMQASEGTSKATDMKNQMREWAKLLEEKYNQKFTFDGDTARETP